MAGKKKPATKPAKKTAKKTAGKTVKKLRNLVAKKRPKPAAGTTAAYQFETGGALRPYTIKQDGELIGYVAACAGFPLPTVAVIVLTEALHAKAVDRLREDFLTTWKSKLPSADRAGETKLQLTVYVGDPHLQTNHKGELVSLGK